MNVVISLCAGILSAHPGCTTMRVPLVVAVTPYACALKAQEVIAEKRELFGDLYVARYGCELKKHDVDLDARDRAEAFE